MNNELNKKNILILNASPNKDGYCSKVKKYLLSNINSDFCIHIFNTSDMNITSCVNCGACKEDENCIFKDDFDLFKQKFENCDEFIIITPTYYLSYPSDAKALIDRLQYYYEKYYYKKIRPVVEKSKNAHLIIVSGRSDNDGLEIIMKQTKVFLSILNTNYKYCTRLKGTDDSPDWDLFSKNLDTIIDFINNSN